MWNTVSCEMHKETDAFDYWREVAFQRLDARPRPSLRQDGFHGKAASLSVAGTTLWRYQSAAVDVHRSASHCRRDQGGEICVLLMRSGRAMLDQGSEMTLAPRDVGFIDASRPLRGWWGEHSESHLVIPRDTARRLFGDLDRLNGLRLPGQSGAGRLLGAQLRLTERLIDGLDPAAAAMAVQTMLDLIGRALGAVRRGDDLPDGRRSASPDPAEAIARYIDRHLDDPDLDVGRIAAALGLSRSSLYRSFPASEGGVARFILHRRLELCRDALLAGGPIGPLEDLATRWGFEDYGAFSRAFRRRFGLAPSALRDQPTAR
ncbi:helix-turn-helix domain-containing protein [Bosea sp. 685]|uniref:helix-turn-helix domain-containing protein n=1 Tax=Bosea sp. 685 TaxID=3080057 RepID=UPI0028935A32|nr:helix-turn-helix domain-containing protein [Bosea sp. 685]WNJ88251.1 helix-turn-helix domain-containing protein [Bosea sp. 685]